MIIITIPVLLSRICSYLYDNGMAAFTTNQYVKRNMFSSTSTNLNCHVNEVKLLAQGKLILFDLMSPLMFYTFLCTRLLPNLTACYTTYLTELWLKYKYEHFLFWGQCMYTKNIHAWCFHPPHQLSIHANKKFKTFCSHFLFCQAVIMISQTVSLNNKTPLYNVLEFIQILLWILFTSYLETFRRESAIVLLRWMKREKKANVSERMLYIFINLNLRFSNLWIQHFSKIE